MLLLDLRQGPGWLRDIVSNTCDRCLAMPAKPAVEVGGECVELLRRAWGDNPRLSRSGLYIYVASARHVCNTQTTRSWLCILQIVQPLGTRRRGRGKHILKSFELVDLTGKPFGRPKQSSSQFPILWSCEQWVGHFGSRNRPRDHVEAFRTIKRKVASVDETRPDPSHEWKHRGGFDILRTRQQSRHD